MKRFFCSVLTTILVILFGLVGSANSQDAVDQENRLLLSSELKRQVTKLNTTRKVVWMEILQNEREIFNVERNLNGIEQKISSHYGEDHYKRFLRILEKAKNNSASKEELNDLNSWGYLHQTDDQIVESITDINKSIKQEVSEIKQKEAESNVLNRLKNKRDSLRHKEGQLTNQIDQILTDVDEENNFRLLISFSFTVLVAVVIAGFYIIAFKREAVADALFGGDKGIQFITLFLVIIAVILFGMMGVFGGKELSALLGALSGYILGRAGSARSDVTKLPPTAGQGQAPTPAGS